MKRSGSIVIHRPADQVFAFLADVGNETSWRDSVTGSGYVGEGAAAVGTVGYTEVSMGGKQVRMDWRIRSFDPGRHVSWQLTGGPWQGGGAYTVRPLNDRTEVTADLEVRLAGALRMLEPVLGFQLGRGLRADLARLQQLLVVPAN